jgi:uncharacterized coiled-coil protein SlyX
MSMMTQELEQRLKNLEIEQDTQDVALNNLSDFTEEIQKLESILKQIDNFTVSKQKSDYSDLRDIDEIEELERKLAHIDEEDTITPSNQFVEGRKEKTNNISSLTSFDKTDKSQHKMTGAKSTRSASSYVICLVFDSQPPQEWSGKGWCEAGKGLHFTNPELAKQTYQKLKKQWPHYPLKIFKR